MTDTIRGVYNDADKKAFLDELTMLCLKHGIYIDTREAQDRYDLPELRDMSPHFRGYGTHGSSGLWFLLSRPEGPVLPNGVVGVDLGEMSKHQKMVTIAKAKGVVLP